MEDDDVVRLEALEADGYLDNYDPEDGYETDDILPASKKAMVHDREQENKPYLPLNEALEICARRWSI